MGGPLDKPRHRSLQTVGEAPLHTKGIRGNKPLHELRKEVGAVIATEQGIYAASKFLRHSDITTTARHYADQKARINVGLGKFLDTTIKPAKDSKQAVAA